MLTSAPRSRRTFSSVNMSVPCQERTFSGSKKSHAAVKFCRPLHWQVQLKRIKE